MSDEERTLSKILAFCSIRVISFPSLAKSLQSNSPIFPAPTIIILHKTTPIFFVFHAYYIINFKNILFLFFLRVFILNSNY